MRAPTIYSTFCECCDCVVLSERPIYRCGTESSVSVVHGGGSFVFVPTHGEEVDIGAPRREPGLCTVWGYGRPEMRMLRPDAEMWLIHEVANV
jgi:hypothetical protein